MENKIYDSPKPAKKKTTVQDRISHWKSTISGFGLIGAALFVLSMELDTNTKGSISGSLLLAGLGAIGYAPKKDK